MAMNAANSDLNVYLTLTTPIGRDRFEIISMTGDEGISQPFLYLVEMHGDDMNVDFSKLLGKNITVNVEKQDGSLVYFNGVVGSLRQRVADDGSYIFTAEVHPWLWLLTMVSDCRIFQNMTAPQIIEQIFKDLGFTDYRLSLTKSYTQRDYCTQYRESSFDFIARLMEEEGIFYFFTHTDSAHTLILADDASAHQPCAGLDKAHFRQFHADWSEETVVADSTLEQRVVVNEYRINDYNFETPSTALLVTAAGTTNGAIKRSLYDYPGNYLKTADGEKIARTRIESQEVPAKTILGRSYCKAFSAGSKFTFADHDRQDMNGDYVLRSVRHEISQERYVNTFEAFPAAVPFRSPIRTPKPVLAGYQTAIVVGSSGEEIFTDKYGRIKVQFPWDTRGKKDENSSCWIRVAQTWAGKGWGAMFIPRVGMEVLVCFLDGDADRPLVIGTVYNSQQTVPYTLPDEKTKSTIKSDSSKGSGGSNEFRFEDKKDSEEIYLHAQKDYNAVVENVAVESVKKSRHLFVQKDDPKIDDKLTDEIVVAGNRTTTVKGGDTEEKHINEGKFTQNVTKEFELTVDGTTLTITAKNDIIIKGKSITIETTGGDFTMKSAKNMNLEAFSAMKSKAGTTLNNEAGTSLTNKSGTDLTNQAGTGLTNKAGTTMENKASISMTNDGGATLTNKASGMQTVDGGGMLTVKGGLVKIN